MAKRTFCEETTGWNRSRAADLHHDPGSPRRRAERRRLCAGNSFERFYDRVLRGNYFGRSHHGTVFWAANGERLCRRGSACSLLSAHAGRNLSSRTAVIRERSAPRLFQIRTAISQRVGPHLILFHRFSSGEKGVLCLAKISTHPHDKSSEADRKSTRLNSSHVSISYA